MAIYIQIMSKRTHFFKSVGRAPPPFPLFSEKVPQREPHGSSTSARLRIREQSCPKSHGGPQLPVLWIEELSAAWTTPQRPGENTHWYNSGWIRPQSGTELQGRSSGSRVPSTRVLRLSTNCWWNAGYSHFYFLVKPTGRGRGRKTLPALFMACHGSNPGMQRTDHFPMQLWCCFLQGTIIKVRFSFQCAWARGSLRLLGLRWLERNHCVLQNCSIFSAVLYWEVASCQFGGGNLSSLVC